MGETNTQPHSTSHLHSDSVSTVGFSGAALTKGATPAEGQQEGSWKPIYMRAKAMD